MIVAGITVPQWLSSVQSQIPVMVSDLSVHLPLAKRPITALTLVEAMEAEEPADELEDIHLVSCIYCLTLSFFMRINSPPSRGRGGLGRAADKAEKMASAADKYRCNTEYQVGAYGLLKSRSIMPSSSNALLHQSLTYSCPLFTQSEGQVMLY